MRNRRTDQQIELKKEMQIKKGKLLSRTLGEKIIAFDNAPKSDVRTFNEIFGEIQGGNQDDELIIGDLYTSNGRYIYRNGKEIKYLFNFIAFYGKIIYDVFDKETGNFIWTHKTLEDIAESYQISESTVSLILSGRNCQAPIKVFKLCHYKSEVA